MYLIYMYSNENKQSLKAISWMNSRTLSTRELQLYFNKIKSLEAVQVIFHHVSLSANTWRIHELSKRLIGLQCWLDSVQFLFFSFFLGKVQHSCTNVS